MKKSKINIIAIDPGTISMGYALWEEGQDEEKLPKVGLVKFPYNRGVDWYERSCFQVNELKKNIGQYMSNCKMVVIELPEYHMVAGVDSIIKVAFLIGRISSLIPIDNLFLVTPTQWKGQLTKEAVINRIRRYYNNECFEFHADMWDAVGIGLWALNKF